MFGGIGELAAWVKTLPELPYALDDDPARIDAITLLEQLKSVAAAVQAQLTVDFAASQHADGAARNQNVDRTRRSIAAQIALARRESPVQGQRHVSLAIALTEDLPQTLRSLAGGEISEWRATLIARATSHLTRADRATVDAEIAPQLPTLGDRRTHDVATAIGYRLDPQAALARNRKAVTDRHVSLRPAPDCMSYLTALLPMTQGIAVYAALHRDATSLNVTDGTRTRAQIMADELVSRATAGAVDGCDADGLPDRIGGGIRIGLVMTDRTLLDGDNQPAQLTGYGPIPAHLARAVAYRANSKIRVWIRRLFADPETAQLISMESKARLFPEAVQQFLRMRDQTCRTPWCDAPIRHADHLQPAADGGPTSIVNGQGLCENCNYIKQSGGWTSRRQLGGGIDLCTPAGKIYFSPPRGAPRSQRWKEHHNTFEGTLGNLVEDDTG